MPGRNLGILSLIIGTVGAVLQTLGIAFSYWFQDGRSVWKNCYVDGCRAVQATVVISTVFGIVHALILLLHVAKQVGPDTRKIIMSAFMSALLAVIFFVVSIIVYDAKLEAGRSFTSGWIFALSCAGAAIVLINLIVILLESCNQRAAGAYSSI